jgi:hypothetical protein
VLDDQPDFAPQDVPLQLADARQVELVHELGVDPPLEAFEFGLFLLVRKAALWSCQFAHLASRAFLLKAKTLGSVILESLA